MKADAHVARSAAGACDCARDGIFAAALLCPAAVPCCEQAGEEKPRGDPCESWHAGEPIPAVRAPTPRFLRDDLTPRGTGDENKVSLVVSNGKCTAGHQLQGTE